MDRNFLQLIVYPTPVYLHLLPEVSHPISFSSGNPAGFQHPNFSFSVLPPTHTCLYFLLHHFEAELSQEKQSFISAPHLVGFTVGLWPGWWRQLFGNDLPEQQTSVWAAHAMKMKGLISLPDQSCLLQSQ